MSPTNTADVVRNGVDTATLFATLDAIKAQPEIAQFRFRARNRWVGGGHNRSTIKGFYAAGAEDTSRTQEFTLDAGEPAILLGSDTGPNPAEYLLHALAACVTTALVYSAAARGVRLTSVESSLEGELDLQAAMGVNTTDYRNGFERIQMTVTIAGDAPPEKLRQIVQRGADRSVVFDSISAGVPIVLDVVTVATPRALGPLHDIARAGLDGLAALLAAGHDRHALFTAFLDLIGAAPSVTVIEDAHWADEATLDLLLFVGRRVGGTPAMVVVTYRSEDVGRDHPLRRVLGDLATAGSVQRLSVPALSAAAVAVLAEPAGRDGAQLRALTGGNPFFVTEALSAPAEHLPTTVRDAVLARASRLSAAARSILDVISLVPHRTEVSLLEPVAAVEVGGVAALDEGIRSGMLVHEGTTVRFRHELARRAVEADVPAARAAILHGRILAHLAVMDTVDPARLSYHAEAAGDPAAVLRYAPVAARQAAGLGAHREAAAHYERALRFGGDATPAQRARLWEGRADECDRTGDLTEALTASAQAVALWHAAGEIAREASVRARRTNTLWNAGRDVEAHESARAALALLEPLSPTPELAQAYAALAMRLMHERDYAGAIAMGEAAIPHAERIGDDWVLAWALVAVGSSRWLSDPDRAVEVLTAALAAARRAGDDLATAGVLCALGKGAAETRRYDLAEVWLAEAVAWCTERDPDSMRSFALAWQAGCQLEQGRWVEATATATATALVDAPALHVPGQILALTVLGRLRVRRGDPDAQDPLDRAWGLAERTGDLDSLWPAAAGRAERAWLAGHPERIKALVADTYRLAVRVEHPWATGELGYWLWMAGAATLETTAPTALPWALQIGGDWQGAAKLWADLGCPYESAAARSHADSANQQLAALQEFHRMGAWPAAELLARRLRQEGVRRLPRPARRTTLDNPAQLTDRQVDVLGLLAEGLPNADIASRLYISPRTVDHHVSAILAKLGVDSRQKAAQWEAARRAQLANGDAPTSRVSAPGVVDMSDRSGCRAADSGRQRRPGR